jgi:ABC-type multidrug transport system ATPase subunit
MESVLICRGLCWGPLDPGLDLSVAPGEFVALRECPEPHESPLLLAAATLRRPPRGEVEVCGQAVEFGKRESLLPLRRLIGYVGPGSALVSDLTLRGNLLFGHCYFGHAEEAQERVLPLVRLLGLEDRLETKPADLPLQCQRAAIYIRELAKRPALIVLDHPGLGLSEQAAQALIRLLAEEKRRGAAAVFSAEAPFGALADRVIVIEEGRVAKELTVEAGRRRDSALAEGF